MNFDDAVQVYTMRVREVKERYQVALVGLEEMGKMVMKQFESEEYAGMEWLTVPMLQVIKQARALQAHYVHVLECYDEYVELLKDTHRKDLPHLAAADIACQEAVLGLLATLRAVDPARVVAPPRPRSVMVGRDEFGPPPPP